MVSHYLTHCDLLWYERTVILLDIMFGIMHTFGLAGIFCLCYSLFQLFGVFKKKWTFVLLKCRINLNLNSGKKQYRLFIWYCSNWWLFLPPSAKSEDPKLFTMLFVKITYSRLKSVMEINNILEIMKNHRWFFTCVCHSFKTNDSHRQSGVFYNKKIYCLMSIYY